MSKRLIALMSGSLLVACLIALPAVGAAEEEEQKITIKDVMKKAMKGGLCKKVASGEASDEEKKELHTLLVGLSKAKPNLGEADSWKKLTGALVKASKAAMEGEEGAGEALKKASNCTACHKEHKPK